MEMSKNNKVSKRLSDFLDKELEEMEKENFSNERTEKHLEEFDKIIAEEIEELENNIDNLTEEEREYLEWLKSED